MTDARRGPAVAAAVAVTALLGWPAVGFLRGWFQDGVPWADHDAAICMRYGQEMLRGVRPYVDTMLLPTAPATFHLGAAVSLLRDLTGLGPTLLHHLALLLFGGLGSTLVWRDVRRHCGTPAAWTALLAYVTVVLMGGSPHFGQRVHIFHVAFLPYLVQRLLRKDTVPSPLLAVAVGFVATIKPHYLLELLAVEAGVLFARRRVDRGVAAGLVVGMAAPALLLVVLAPGSLTALFTRVAPFALFGGYAAFRGDAMIFARSPWNVALASAMAGTAGAALLCVLRRVIRPWQAVAVGGAVAFAYLSLYQQGKYWHYQMLSTTVVCAGVGPWLLTAGCARGGVLLRGAGWAMTAACVLAAGHASLRLESRATSPQPSADGLIALCDGDPRILLIEPGVHGFLERAALETELTLIGPGSCHPEIGVISHMEDARERAAALAPVVALFRERIARDRPALVLAVTHRAFMRRTDAHAFLSEAGGLFPLEGYIRVPDDQVERACPGLGCVVYRRH